MQVFLGDAVTLINALMDDQPTYVTGQVRGIVLNDSKQVERIYIHGLLEGLLLVDGWKFVDDEDQDDDDD
jgi:hypothetical protein